MGWKDGLTDEQQNAASHAGKHARLLAGQEAGLPLILMFASDGTYERAMKSEETMEKFVDGLIREMDNAVNMDW